MNGLDATMNKIATVKGRITQSMEEALETLNRGNLMKTVQLEKDLIKLIQTLNGENCDNRGLEKRIFREIYRIETELKSIKPEDIPYWDKRNITSRYIVDMELLLLEWTRKIQNKGLNKKEVFMYEELRFGVDKYKEIYYNVLDILSLQRKHCEMEEIMKSLQIPEVYIFMNLIPKVQEHVLNVNKNNHEFKMRHLALLQLNLMGIEKHFLEILSGKKGLRREISNALNTGINSILGYMVVETSEGVFSDCNWRRLNNSIEYVYANVYESLKEVNWKLFMEDAPDAIRDYVINGVGKGFNNKSIGEKAEIEYLKIVRSTLEEMEGSEDRERLNSEALAITLIGMNLYM